jgi:hypothetical protein
MVVELIRNDKTFPLSFTVTDSDGAVVDLTGAQITFKMALQGATTTKVASTSVSIIVATSGTCSYTVASTDLDTIGLYNAELTLNYTTTGRLLTVQLDSIKVVEDLP